MDPIRASAPLGPQLQPQVNRGWWGIFIAGFAVGVIGLVGLVRNAEGANTQVYQGVGFLIAAMFISYISLRWIDSWTRASVGIYLAAHILVAVAAGLVYSSPWEAIMRYVLLLPMLALMLGVVELGPAAVNALRAGLTAAAFAAVLYSLLHIDMGRLVDPKYRGVDNYLNPNSLGYYSAICGISFLDYAIKRLQEYGSQRKFGTVMRFGGFALCVVSILATKSRTAALAFVVGALTECVLVLGFKKTLLIALGPALIVLLALPGFLGSAGDWIATVFEFNDRYRSIGSATGRIDSWMITLTRIWPPHWAIGTGPGMHAVYGQQWDLQFVSAHNALLVNLAETGIVGTLPLLAILIGCARNVRWAAYDPARRFAAVIFAAAVAESMFEPTLFSIGNAGGLLVLLSIAVLGRARTDMYREYLESADAQSDQMAGQYAGAGVGFTA
ncbi:MAG TPA: O-antigen ligase family protein [Phycisphaerae bacterium]|jgi:hypothetical protein|nr:O-antigen ligase family protein [Phycisphaerae bacterium]